MCYMASRSRNVGVRELRQNLSVYLARVKKGQALTVTEHGRAVAEFRPLPTPTDAVGRLVDEGRVVPARRPPSALPRPLKLPAGRPVSALLDELREDSI
jgi:antitoxin (DNA-binding transcriptional repressor) of toxin-antitoxin stability system